MKAILTAAIGFVLALLSQGTAAEPPDGARSLVPALSQRVKITPEAPRGGCAVLHFLSDRRLLASHDYGGPSIWDATTGHLERKLSAPGESKFPRVSYVTPDGKWVADRFHPSDGSGEQFRVWDLSRDRRITVSGPNMEGNVAHAYITRDKKTLWLTRSANPLSGSFNQVRLTFTEADPLTAMIEFTGKSGQEGVPHYHCATENLLIYFQETSPDAKGMTLCVWDLETRPHPSQRIFTLKGHSPKSFWRAYQTFRADPGRAPHSYLKRVDVDGILEDRYTEPAWKDCACLAVPQRSELYVAVPYSKQLRGDTEGMRLTIVDTKEALKEKLSFDLPLFQIQGMALHPKRPILFCVTPDDRLLVIDTRSRAIVKEVRLKEKVSRHSFIGLNPAVSPDGRLVAVGNADGTISVLDFSE
jgi:WD40 repeat protein